MLTGLVIAVVLGILASKPGLKWLNDFIMLIYMIAVPFIVLGYYHAIPSFGEVFNIATISILLIYIPVGISEAFSYTPILGSSSYLVFLTGNIMNLKVPCAVNALKVSETEQNTPEGDAIASVAVAVSSIMTVAILIIPALFGSLTLGLFSNSSSGDKIVKGGTKGVIPVIVLVSVICLFVRITTGGSLFGAIGFLIIAMLPIAIITSRIMWKKGIIKVVDNPNAIKKSE
ncbi:MAG: hypothetical protein PUF77_02045 [Clostridiales bacterium]|nr:hypothetical protein [Clostridiales bacterium]